MELKALEDRVILEVVEEEEESKTQFGLVLIAGTKENNNEAIVVAVGPGHVLPSGKRLDVAFEVGMKVIYNPMAVQTLEHNGKNYVVSFMKDILAIIEEN